jgi:DNA-binding transcriptional LysR family regulator
MRPRVRVRGLDTACRMVALGAGIAVVPEAAARRWDTQGTLAMMRMDDPWAERQLMVIVRRLDALSPHARKLVDDLAGAPERAGVAVSGPAGG